LNEYILAPEAESDLDEIAEYITRDSIDAAVRIVRRIRSTFRLLADNPAMGRMRIDLAAAPPCLSSFQLPDHQPARRKTAPDRPRAQ